MSDSQRTPDWQSDDGRHVLYRGDCLDVLPLLDNVADAVIADPPYGGTRCVWDAVIPFVDMWIALQSVMCHDTPVILFGTEPFSSHLRLSNLAAFKYDWIWNKPKGTGFLNAKKQPMRGHEIISVFAVGKPGYYPQKTQGHERKRSFRDARLQTDVYGRMENDYLYDSTERYPRSVITFSSDTQNSSLHPTQKPVKLMKYLIQTYTLKDQTVLDFTAGSCTTGVACIRTGRRFIGIEKERKYFDIAVARMEKELAAQEELFPFAKEVDA